MNEPTHTEAVKTDLPSLNPNRRKRLALRFAALVAAVSVLGAAYASSQPRDVVWWTSPPFDNSSRVIKLLIPAGWKVVSSLGPPDSANYQFEPRENYDWLKWLGVSLHESPPYILLSWNLEPKPRPKDYFKDAGEWAGSIHDPKHGQYVVDETHWSSDRRVWVRLQFVTTDKKAFYRNSKQIRNSLRVQ